MNQRDRGRISAAALWLCVIVSCALLGFGTSRRAAFQDAPLPPKRAPEIVYSLWLRNDLNPPRIVVNLRTEVPVGESSVTVQMPVWSPGDYHVQNHGKYVQDFRADGLSGSNQTGELRVSHPDQNTWRVGSGGARSVLVTYSVPQTPKGIFSDNVTVAPHYGFVNGPSAFAYVVGRKASPARLFVYLPSGWHAEMPLPEVEAAGAKAEAAYSADDYDTLADSPLVMGDAEGLMVRRFKVDAVAQRAVFFHTPITSERADAFVPMLMKVAAAENKIMGGPPYNRYDFLFDVGGEGGGLEHLNSARLLLWPGGQPRGIEAFVAHEFFHLWNVKRIRPLALGPFDYVNPPKTRSLWFAEGVTEYYAHVAVRRAGITDEEAFYSHWKRAIGRMQTNPASKRITAEEASLRVWESGSSQGFGGLSYYDKGELIGLCMDLKIRNATGGKKSLDDVMRLLLDRHNPPKPGYGENEIRSVVSEVAKTDLSAFYDLLARSTDAMPFAECLGYVGLDTAMRPLANASPEQSALRNGWSSGVAASAKSNGP